MNKLMHLKVIALERTTTKSYKKVLRQVVIATSTVAALYGCGSGGSQTTPTGTPSTTTNQGTNTNAITTDPVTGAVVSQEVPTTASTRIADYEIRWMNDKLILKDIPRTGFLKAVLDYSGTITVSSEGTQLGTGQVDGNGHVYLEISTASLPPETKINILYTPKNGGQQTFSATVPKLAKAADTTVTIADQFEKAPYSVMAQSLGMSVPGTLSATEQAILTQLVQVNPSDPWASTKLQYMPAGTLVTWNELKQQQLLAPTEAASTSYLSLYNAKNNTNYANMAELNLDSKTWFDQRLEHYELKSKMYEHFTDPSASNKVVADIPSYRLMAEEMMNLMFNEGIPYGNWDQLLQLYRTDINLFTMINKYYKFYYDPLSSYVQTERVPLKESIMDANADLKGNDPKQLDLVAERLNMTAWPTLSLEQIKTTQLNGIWTLTIPKPRFSQIEVNGIAYPSFSNQTEANIELSSSAVDLTIRLSRLDATIPPQVLTISNVQQRIQYQNINQALATIPGNTLGIPSQVSYTASELAVINRIISAGASSSAAIRASFAELVQLESAGKLTDHVWNHYVLKGFTGTHIQSIMSFWNQDTTIDRDYQLNVGRSTYEGAAQKRYNFIANQISTNFEQGKMVFVTDQGEEVWANNTYTKLQKVVPVGVMSDQVALAIAASGSVRTLYHTLSQASSDFNDNQANFSGTSQFTINYEKFPYLQFSVERMDRTGTPLKLALFQKQNGKFFISPANLEEDTPAFSDKMMELRGHLTEVYLRTQSTDAANTLAKLEAKDYAGLLASKTHASGPIYAEQASNGVEDYKNQVRTLMGTNANALLSLNDTRVSNYIMQTINSLYSAGSKTEAQTRAFFDLLQQLYLPTVAPNEIGSLGQTSFLLLDRLQNYMDKEMLVRINPSETLDDELAQLPQQMTFLPSTTSVSVKGNLITVVSQIGQKMNTYKLTLANNIVTEIATTGVVSTSDQGTYVSQSIPLDSASLQPSDIEYLNRKVLQALVGSGDVILQNLLEMGSDQRLHLRSMDAYSKLNNTGNMVSHENKTLFMLRLDKTDKLNPLITVIENAAGTDPLAIKFTRPLNADGTPDNIRTGQVWLKMTTAWSAMSWDIMGLNNISTTPGGQVSVMSIWDDIFNFFKKMFEQWLYNMVGGWLLSAIQDSIKGLEITRQAMALIQTANEVRQSAEIFMSPYKQTLDVANQAIAIFKSPQSLLDGLFPHEIVAVKQQVQQNIATFEQTIAPGLLTSISSLQQKYETEAKVYIKIGDHVIEETNGQVTKIKANIDATGTQLTTQLDIDMKLLKEKYAAQYPDIDWEHQMVKTDMVLPKADGSYPLANEIELAKSFAMPRLWQEVNMPTYTVQDTVGSQQVSITMQQNGAATQINLGTEQLDLSGSAPILSKNNKLYSLDEVLKGNITATEYLDAITEAQPRYQTLLSGVTVIPDTQVASGSADVVTIKSGSGANMLTGAFSPGKDIIYFLPTASTTDQNITLPTIALANGTGSLTLAQKIQAKAAQEMAKMQVGNYRSYIDKLTATIQPTNISANAGVSAADWAQTNLSGSKKMPYDKGWVETAQPYADDFSKRHALECKDFIYFAYKLGAAATTIQRDANTLGVWFKKNGTYFSGSEIPAGGLQKGDVLFLTDTNGKLRHLAMVADVRADGSYSIQGAHPGNDQPMLYGTDILKDLKGTGPIIYFSNSYRYDRDFVKLNLTGIGRL